MTTAEAATAPRCPCGCGASLAGWSHAGRSMGLRDRVRRVHHAEHGSCRYCGQDLDQYRECDECSTEPTLLRQLTR